MRTVAAAIVALAFAAAAPQPAQAQVQLGPTVAFHDDFDLGVGFTLMGQTPSLGERLGFMGDFLYFFPDADDVDYLEFNANLTYDFTLPESTVTPFGLLGLNVARVSVDVVELEDGSETELGLNLGAGVRFDLGSFRPSVGGRFEINGGEGFVLFGVLPFEVGSR